MQQLYELHKDIIMSLVNQLDLSIDQAGELLKIYIKLINQEAAKRTN